MRASEIVQRVGRDLDDNGRLLWIDAAKTEAGRRVVSVPEELRPHLKKLAAAVGPDGRLWNHRPPWVRAQVKRLCQAAGVPEVTAHGLRGGHSSLGIEAGLSPQVVAATLGHASPSMTLAAYARPEAVSAAKQQRILATVRRVG
jgi:integrase